MANANLITTVLQHITDYGYGIVRFEVQETGEIRHTLTQITIKPEPDESLSDFIERLRNQLMPGDRVEFTLRNGKIDIARVDRQPKK